MLIRREAPADVPAIRTVTCRAFADPARPGVVPGEGPLVDELRAGPAWLPALSLVAEGADAAVVGHVVCTRSSAGDDDMLILGPLSVDPDHQRAGVGSALVHAVLAAADALDEPLVALLGSTAYYGRFGFRLAGEFGIVPPPDWTPHFQVRPLAAYRPTIRGVFRYPAEFDRV